MSIPISIGTGQASVAAQEVGGLQYQQIQVLGRGGSSVMSVNPDNSINVSIIGVPTVGAVIIGGVSATITGSVITVWRDSSVIGVVTGSVVAIPTGNQSVSGTVGASIIGWAPVQLSNTSVITVWNNSSVISVPTGSVITVNIGSVISINQANSIVGTYVEDAAHNTGDRGLFTLGVRNDTLSSVTSADTEYSQFSTGPAGELISTNAPFTKWVSGTADFRNGNAGASIVVIAAQGASIFTYITGVQVANMGSASVLVTLAGTGSTLGYTIAPAGGGSNIYYQNALKTPANGTFAASISGVSSVLVSAQGFIAKI